MSVPGDPRLGFTVNLPAALRGEQVHSLPPYAPVRASKVDCYPGAPAEWPRSTGNTASYFIPIVEGRGMWLDFNACWAHPHHVAIVVSIQGVNPLTGHKADKLELERYAMDSSVEEWLRGRQNYLSTTATPQGMLWIDGFRAADGTPKINLSGSSIDNKRSFPIKPKPKCVWSYESNIKNKNVFEYSKQESIQ